MEKYLTFKSQELLTEQSTIAEVFGWNSIHRNQMNFFLNLDTPLNKINGEFKNMSIFYVTVMLLRIPFKFESVYILLNKGYYLESLPIIRKLYEIFIKIRYFMKFPDKAEDHLVNGKRTKFKVLFNEFSTVEDVFYQRYYGKLLSELVHGGLGEVTFTLDREFDYAHRSNKLDMKMLSFPLNMYHFILIGYINLVKELERNYNLLLSTDFEQDRNLFEVYMSNWQKSQLESFPENKEFFEYLTPIITF
ncbi:DUF5677 domain-containing protein [Leptospira neocaledonica]|nr:DUF5677 domain-containing protein [Leptospira neocaledonica]